MVDMWMHHDASWWALVLAIVALVLMIPVNLFANFMTPILKNWWATRSEGSLRKPISRLDAELQENVNKESFSRVEVISLKQRLIVGLVSVQSTNLILGAGYVGVWFMFRARQIHLPLLLGVVFVFSILVNAWNLWQINSKIRRDLRRGTERGKAELESLIGKLQKKLDERHTRD
jgi:hypothetical protein